MNCISGIAIERYLAIERPLHYTSIMTRQRIITSLIIIWLYPFFISTSALYWNRWTPGVPCYSNFIFSKAYSIVMVSINPLMILSVILILYLRIGRIAYIHSHKVHDISVHNQGEQPSHQRFRDETKAAKTLGIVIGLFALSAVPYIICTLLVFFLEVPPVESHITRQFLRLALALGFLGSALNPLIYAYKLKTFRKAINGLGITLPCMKQQHDDILFAQGRS